MVVLVDDIPHFCTYKGHDGTEIVWDQTSWFFATDSWHVHELEMASDQKITAVLDDLCATANRELTEGHAGTG